MTTTMDTTATAATIDEKQSIMDDQVTIVGEKEEQTTITESRTSQVFKMTHKKAIGYAEYGDENGIPVLYFHSTPGSRYEAKLFHESALQSNIRLIAPERPGIGLSTGNSRKRLVRDYSKDMLALLQHLNIPRIRLFGIAAGGAYALACAADPDLSPKILGVLIVAGVVHPDIRLAGLEKPERLGLALVRRLPRFLLERTWGIKDIATKARDSDPEPLRRLVRASLAAQSSEAAELATDKATVDARAEIFRSVYAQGPHGHFNDNITLLRSWGFKLEDIIGPRVDFLYGGKDISVKADQGKLMAEKIPGATWKCNEDDTFLAITTDTNELFGMLKKVS